FTLRGGTERDRKDPSVRILSFHKVHSTVGSSELVLNATFKLQILNLQKMRLPGGLVRQLKLSMMGSEAPDCRDAQCCRRAKATRSLQLLSVKVAVKLLDRRQPC